MNIRITGSGSYIPDAIEKNEDFHQHTFLNTDGSRIDHPNEVIVEKFKAITGIAERRYADNHLVASDIGAIAAEKAIADANIDPEELDYIIVAHNFGDVRHNTIQSDILPCLAARVKHNLTDQESKVCSLRYPLWLSGLGRRRYSGPGLY